MINVIQNTPSPKKLVVVPEPTIKITSLDAGWEQAYQNWLNGKNPTNSPEWKKGCFAFTMNEFFVEKDVKTLALSI